MKIILDALLDTVMEFFHITEIFHITEVQLEEFTFSFVCHLPKYLQDALPKGQAVA
ncbi:MAG: hypothetical protein SPG10_17115 [Enterocloster clostridioformis]|nr:hypothetical protein [Enterocloster clostridioformis]